MPQRKQNRFISIRVKLLGATVITGSLALLIAIAGLYSMQRLNQQLKQVVDVAAERVKLAHLVRQNLATTMRAERNMKRTADAEEFDRLAAEADARIDSIETFVTSLRQLNPRSSDLRELDEFRETFDAWKRNHLQIRQFSGMNSQRLARAISIEQGDPAFQSFEESMERLIESVIGDDPNADASARTESSKTGSSIANGKEVSPTAKLKRIAELRRVAMRLQRLEKNLVMQGALADFDASSEIVAEMRFRVQESQDDLASVLTAQEQDKLNAAAATLNDYLDIHARVLDAARQEDNVPGSLWARGAGESLADKVETISQSMVVQSERSLDEYEVDSSALHVTFRNTLLLLSVSAIAISVFVSLWIGGGVARSVRQLSAYAHMVHRAKDLTQPIPRVGNDETGELAEAFEGMRVALLSQNSRLARLNDTLEHKNDEIEQFVYSVSHDLKSPLVSCKGLVGLINEDIADGEFEEVRNSAARLSDVTDQMSQSIDELLMFSRLGHSPLDQIVVDMEALLHELAEEWLEREDSPTPQIEIQPDIHPIYGDPIALRRVFDNLLGNAVKYASGNSGAQIRMGSEKHGRKIRYFVKDHGPGIDPEYHKKIFKLFQRLDTSQKGTGIGLASVAKIVRQHRGRVWVESVPGDGATFWVELPNTNPDSI